MQAFSNNWIELASGKSAIFIATVRVSLAFATVLIAFWSVGWFNTLSGEGYSQKTVNELIAPVIITLTLAINNGSLISGISLALHNATDTINYRIYQETINGNKIELAIKQSKMSQALQEVLGGKVEQCRLLPITKNDPKQTDPQTACIDKSIQEVNDLVQKYEEQGLKLDLKFDLDINKLVVNAVNSEIQRTLLMIFSDLEMAFVFLIEIAMLLNAYVAPIFLALSLLPSQAKLIYAWLSGWVGLGLVKVSYTIIVGIATSSIANSNQGSPLLLPLLLGVFSPILALTIASGGGMAMFNSLTSLSGGGLRLALKLGSRGK